MENCFIALHFLIIVLIPFDSRIDILFSIAIYTRPIFCIDYSYSGLTATRFLCNTFKLDLEEIDLTDQSSSLFLFENSRSQNNNFL